MNCLEFRRRLLTDPLSGDEDLLAHEATCAACAPFAQDLRAREIRMRSLLQNVVPPPGLAERVSLAARFEQRAERRRQWWYSAAAAVLLTVGVSMVSLFSTSIERTNVALAQSVINHIEDEASHLRAAHPVPTARVNWVFKRFGAELAADIGPVHFAAECLMRKRNGVHLVMPGKMGPVTVFFMPGEMTDTAMPITSARFNGQIVPTDWGSIAVVGEAGETVDGLGARMAAAVRWPASTQAGVSVPVGGNLLAASRLTQQKNG